MKVVAIIQARASSTRLPGKILMNLAGKSILVNIVERVRRAKLVDEVVVATSNEPSDDEVEEMLKEKGIACFRGSLENVLERFYLCAKAHEADIVIRLTGDNALVSPEIVDGSVEVIKNKKVDYLHYKDGLPLGMAMEVFTFDSLSKAYTEAKDAECLEHVTPYIRCNPDMFTILDYADEVVEDHSDWRFTIDTPKDYEFVSKIYDHFNNNLFCYNDVIELLKENEDWLSINSDVIQNTLAYNGEK